GKVMFYGIIAWSIACIGGGFSRTVGQFGFFRSMLGAAEPTNFPAQLKVITIWFSGKMRATANSLCVAGSSIGAIIAPPLVAWLATTYDWETAFIVLGAVGIVIAVLWKLIYKDPPPEIVSEVAATDADPELFVEEGKAPVAAEGFSWNQLWRTKSLYGILLIRFVSDPVWYFCLFWLP